MCKLFLCAYVHSFLFCFKTAQKHEMSLYNTYLKRFVKKNLKKNAKKKFLEKKKSFFRKKFFATGLIFERFLAPRSRFFEKVNGLGVLGCFVGNYLSRDGNEDEYTGDHISHPHPRNFVTSPNPPVPHRYRVSTGDGFGDPRATDLRRLNLFQQIGKCRRQSVGNDVVREAYTKNVYSGEGDNPNIGPVPINKGLILSFIPLKSSMAIELQIH
ncbi:hypothetical protein LXL04_022520 [Taraxacum kok-saghyz]